MNRSKQPQQKPQTLEADGEEQQDIQTEELAPEDTQLLMDQLNEAEQKRDEYLYLSQRVQADFDNFRRRNRQVAAESFEDGARAFIKTILPVLDNLERALIELREDDPLYHGVRMVERQLQEALSHRGVQVISRLGQPFDPTLEDAIARGAPEEGEPGTVCDVLLKGYKMGDNVLRHATVRVVPDN